MPAPISSMCAGEIDGLTVLPALGMGQAEQDAITTPATRGGKFVGSGALWPHRDLSNRHGP